MSMRRAIGISGRARCTLVLIATCLGAFAAAAQSYPTKPVEMTIPWPPGGRTDIMVRMLAPFLEKELGQPVPVVNRVGGAGVTGMTFFKNSPPDGYMISSGGIALSSMQYQKKHRRDAVGLHLVRARLFHADGARRSRHVAVQDGSGIPRVRQSQPRQVEARQHRRRQLDPSCVGGDGEEARHQDHASSLSRRGTRDNRTGRWRGRFRPGLDGGVPHLSSRTRRYVSWASLPTYATRNCRTCRPSKEQGIDFGYMAFEGLHVPNGVPRACSRRGFPAPRRTR